MRTDYNAAERGAYELGVEHATNAASWVVHARLSPTHHRRLVRMFDDGDPELDTYLPTRPDLSGEWADEPTPASLVAEFAPDSEHPEIATALSDAYEAGVDDTFRTECERILREAS